MKTMPTIFLIVCLLFAVSLLAFDQRDGAHIAKQIYTRERVDDLRAFGLLNLRERLEVRSIADRERRIALVPCVYRHGDKLLAWGLDLPQPDRDWVTLEKSQTSTVQLDAHLLRFVESAEHQCWCAVVWHSEWRIVPNHASVNCLTNAVAVVTVPPEKDKE